MDILVWVYSSRVFTVEVIREGVISTTMRYIHGKIMLSGSGYIDPPPRVEVIGRGYIDPPTC